MALSDVTPDRGPATGGTPITIHGSGFFEPLTVTIGRTVATVLRVSDSEVVARAPAIDSDCSDHPTTITITNIDDGDQVTGTYTYIALHPAFTSIPSLIAGDSASIAIANEQNATGKFTLAGRVILARSNADGTFTFRVPAVLIACGGAPLQTTLTFTDAVTGCSVSQAVTVEASRDCEPRSPRHGAK